MIIQESMTLKRKLEILSDAAKYDVACTSSGVDRKGDGKGMGNSIAAGICHSFAQDGRCISLLKILIQMNVYLTVILYKQSLNDVVRTSLPQKKCVVDYGITGGTINLKGLF